MKGRPKAQDRRSSLFPSTHALTHIRLLLLLLLCSRSFLPIVSVTDSTRRREQRASNLQTDAHSADKSADHPSIRQTEAKVRTSKKKRQVSARKGEGILVCHSQNSPPTDDPSDVRYAGIGVRVKRRHSTRKHSDIFVPLHHSLCLPDTIPPLTTHSSSHSFVESHLRTTHDSSYLSRVTSLSKGRATTENIVVPQTFFDSLRVLFLSLILCSF